MPTYLKWALTAGVIAVFLGLGLVARLSWMDAREERAERIRNCESRNEARQDVVEVDLLILEMFDPDRSSPIWRETPPSPQYPNGGPGIEQVIREKLNPINCDNLE